MRRAPLVCLLVLAGCGGGGGSQPDDRLSLTTPKGPPEATATPEAARGRPITATERRVIRGWSDALRQGRVDRAVSYWRVPATAYNGGQPIRLLTRRAIRRWNEALPCGAKLESIGRDSNYALATFVLTDRKGYRRGCDGLGNKARTLFLIRAGKIVQWLRAPDPVDASEGPSGSTS